MPLIILLLVSLALPQDAGILSREKELALGQSLAAGVESRSKLIKDPSITGYVSGIVRNLASHAAIDHPIAVKIVEDREPRASALPGGFLFVSSGILEKSGTEAELAAVLAHELAHISARHGMKAPAEDKAQEASGAPIVFAGGSDGICARFESQAAVPLGFRAVSDRYEEEADLLGLRYLDQAGYDPSALVEIFRKMNAASSESVVERTRQLLSFSQDRLVTTSQFQETKRRLAIIFPPLKFAPPSLEKGR